MKDELKTASESAAKALNDGPRRSRVDGSYGFVPADEVRNVFVEALSRLDHEIWPAKGPVPPRDMVLEFAADLQFRLLARASANLEKVLGKVAPKAKIDEGAAAASAAAMAAREARLAKYKG